MSGQPDPSVAQEERDFEVDETELEADEPQPVERQPPTGKANRLAVTALILACIGPFLVSGILATVFGMVALDEIEESEGAERGAGMAKWAIGLGFLNIAIWAALIVLFVALVVA